MKSILFIVLIVILIPSCQKDKKDQIFFLTEKEKLLTSHGWHNSSIKINGVELTLTPWSVDDCWYFRADGTFTYSYGVLKSYMHEKDLIETWELSEDETTLIYALTSPGITITENEMILTVIYEDETRVYTYVPC
jgi:hypothetical protein